MWVVRLTSIDDHRPKCCRSLDVADANACLRRVALVMGIVNVTPDSFSDGGQFCDHRRRRRAGLRNWSARGRTCSTSAANRRARQHAGPGRRGVGRVVPVVTALVKMTDVPISIDTSKAEVARAGLQAGAQVINDVTGLTGDPRMAEVVRDQRAGVIVMHMQGTPATMQAARIMTMS